MVLPEEFLLLSGGLLGLFLFGFQSSDCQKMHSCLLRSNFGLLLAEELELGRVVVGLLRELLFM